MTQDELLEALWPKTYVNPEVIKKYVLGIRKALGDQTDKPVFIAIFPRRGYEFIAPVRDETTGALSGSILTALSIRQGGFPVVAFANYAETSRMQNGWQHL